MKKKVKEILLYTLFGIPTTLIMMGVFQGLEFLLAPLWHDSFLLSNIIAFLAAVTFSFIVNKLFVFRTKGWRFQQILSEGGSFLLSRVGSFLLINYLFTFLFNVVFWAPISGKFSIWWESLPRVLLELISKFSQMPPENTEMGYRFLMKWCVIAPFEVAINFIFTNLIFKFTDKLHHVLFKKGTKEASL